MPITFNCPGCTKGYTVPEEFAGRATKCRACGALLTIPFASEPPVAQLAATPMAPLAMPALAAPVAEAVPVPTSGGGVKFKIAGLLAAVALVVILLGYTAYALLPSGSPSSMKYMPDNSTMLLSGRVSDMMKSGAWDDIKKEFPTLEKTMNDGLKDAPFGPADVNFVLAGIGNMFQQEFVVALELNKGIKEDDVLKSAKNTKFVETKVGDYKVFEADGMAWSLPHSKTFLLGKTELLKAVLKRDKTPEFSAALQKALKETDMSLSMAAAMDVKGFYADPVFAGVMKQSAFDPDSMDAGAMNVVVGKDIKITSISLCKDIKAADDGRKMVEGGVIMIKKFAGNQLPKEFIELLDDVKITQKGTRLTSEVTVKVGPITKAIKTLMEQAGQPFGPNGRFIQ